MNYEISSANECRNQVDYDPLPKDFKVLGVVVQGVVIYDFFAEFAGRFGCEPDQYGFEKLGDDWYWASKDKLVGAKTRLTGNQVQVVFEQRTTLESEWVTVSKYKLTRGFFDFEEMQ